ncbi:Bacterial alpha-L-rhamnosidase [Fulvivirga sp. M361]|uniref:family 78 glycoside hydrolase catalytic domain n=1 Tax=Fulvivirga sp. M361 TaxID=2594266 RepID=UPI00117A8ECF|nr:family 78 glycoside hydrolase catalytic domain [Fulvivirga sp. M361]TRX60017.1 Bacterial alpha-L-rhamnosidase [Fulvivirga sp. M361]
MNLTVFFVIASHRHLNRITIPDTVVTYDGTLKGSLTINSFQFYVSIQYTSLIPMNIYIIKLLLFFALVYTITSCSGGKGCKVDYYEGAKMTWQASWISERAHPVSNKRQSMPVPIVMPKLPGDSMATLMRREYTVLRKPKAVTVYISGLGYYELYINGQKVGDHVLDPVFSDYQRTVHYLNYDVTEMIQSGDNAVGVILGNGFYNYPSQNFVQFSESNWRTPNKLLLQFELEFNDNSREVWVSNESWKWSNGAIVFNSVQGGETFDSRKQQEGWLLTDYDDGHWDAVKTVEAPPGRMRPQVMPPMRVVKTLPALGISESEPGIYLVDFGANITGWATLNIKKCPEAKHIRLFYNEVLTERGTLDKNYSTTHSTGRFQEGRYICNGNPGVFNSRFSYYGFRYVQIEGLDYRPELEDIVASSVHTDLPSIGNFECSNERLNQLQSAVRRTLLNSVHSMPGEEPTREKVGWTLDAGLITMDTYLYNFDAITTYQTYLQNLMDAQEKSGHIPPIVPTNGWGFLNPDTHEPVLYDDPWWGGTIFYVTDRLYLWTGNTSHIDHAYEAMKRYLAFVVGTADDSLLVHWSLGDWLDPGQNRFGFGPGWTPPVQTSTQAVAWMAGLLSKYAKILDRQDDISFYQKLEEKTIDHFNNQFLDRRTGWYRDSSQTAQAMPLWLNIVPEGMKSNVEERFFDAVRMRDGHIFCGFLGIQPILTWLSENNHIDIAYEMVTKENSPGWLHMVKDHKSTLGENMNAEGYGTGHHPFGANMGHWFYRYLAGIAPDKAKPGWKHFILAPKIPENLDWVKASYKSPVGLIRSEWEQGADYMTYKFTVPIGSEAIIRLAFQESFQIEYNGKPLSADDYRIENGKIVKGLIAGEHHFQLLKKE